MIRTNRILTDNKLLCSNLFLLLPTDNFMFPKCSARAHDCAILYCKARGTNHIQVYVEGIVCSNEYAQPAVPCATTLILHNHAISLNIKYAEL